MQMPVHDCRLQIRWKCWLAGMMGTIPSDIRSGLLELFYGVYEKVISHLHKVTVPLASLLLRTGLCFALLMQLR